MSESDDSVDYYYVDVDQTPELAERFGIFSIPTLILFKAGAEVNRSVGFIPEDQVRAFAHQ
ncbi:MAG: thioredoxin family protein [Alicyclobacillus sp.]|nr:thioredoxin family protein [Alicyclobacillus sp.]